MRKIFSVLGALILLSFVSYLICSGSVILPDYWTEVAVALTMMAIGLLVWGFKPEIMRLVKGKKSREKPTIAVDVGRSIDLEHDLTSFDKTFEDLKQATQPKTKARMMDYFQPELHHLCYKLPWNDEVKRRIEKVLNTSLINLLMTHISTVIYNILE